MVGGEDDDGVVRLARLLERIEETADLGVQHGDVGVVGAVGPLQLLAVHVVARRSAKDQLQERLGEASDLVEAVCPRQRELDAVVHRLVGPGRDERRMRLEERGEDEPRDRSPRPSSVICARVRSPTHVRLVKLGGQSSSEGVAFRVGIEGAVVELSRVRIAHGPPLDVVAVAIGGVDAVVDLDVVPAHRAGVLGRGRPVVQLANRRRPVAGVLQVARHQRLARVERRVVDAVLVRMRIAAGEPSDSRRHADRRLHEAVREVRRLLGEAIESRRANELGSRWRRACRSAAGRSSRTGCSDADLGLSAASAQRRGPMPSRETYAASLGGRLNRLVLGRVVVGVRPRRLRSDLFPPGSRVSP